MSQFSTYLLLDPGLCRTSCDSALHWLQSLSFASAKLQIIWRMGICFPIKIEAGGPVATARPAVPQ